METLILALVCGAIFVLLTILKSPKVTGARGEARVNRRIERRIEGTGDVLLKDVTLATERGTTQIDQIVVSTRGIFVVETKNMSGWIFGGETQARWTQVLHKKKVGFQNPLRQNFKHVKAVLEATGIDKEHIHNLVAFVGDAEPKTKMPPNVFWNARALSDHIAQPGEAVLTFQAVRDAVAALSEKRKAPGRQTNRAHIAGLRATEAVVSNVEPNGCLKCGAPMKERSNRKTGETFLGCSRFPKCKGTRQVQN